MREGEELAISLFFVRWRKQGMNERHKNSLKGM
jgi:hypothetical protein